MLEAVVFDMDGVLIDSEPVHVNAEILTFAEYGIHLTEEFLQNNMGKGARPFFEELIETNKIPISVDDLLKAYKEQLARLYLEEVELFPGIQVLLESCRSARLPMAVASSTDKDLVMLVLDKLAITPFFAHIVSGQEVARYKPAPDIFLEAAARLDANPANSVVIEDSTAGIRAAVEAGMPCIGFRSGSNMRQDLSGADLIVESIDSITVSLLKDIVS